MDVDHRPRVAATADEIFHDQLAANYASVRGNYPEPALSRQIAAIAAADEAAAIAFLEANRPRAFAADKFLALFLESAILAMPSVQLNAAPLSER